MKTFVVIQNHNNPNYIRLQHRSLEQYFKTEYELIIFNDGKPFADHTNFYNPNCAKEIQECCLELNIRCIDIPQEIHDNRTLFLPNTQESHMHNPNTRNSDNAQFITHTMLEKLVGQPVYLFFLDSDIFLCKDFNINEFMNGYDAAGWDIMTRHVNDKLGLNLISFSPNFAIFDLSKCPDIRELCWDCGKINGISVDGGGQSYQYFEKYKKQLRINLVDVVFFKDEADIDNCNSNLFQMCPKTYLHSICKIFKYSLDKVACRAQNPCRKEWFEVHDGYNFHHLKNGSNWDGAHKSFRKYEFLYSRNYLLNISNHDYFKNKWKKYIDSRKSFENKIPSTFCKKNKKQLLVSLKNKFCDEPQSYDKLLLMYDLYKNSDMEMLLLHPSSIKNKQQKDEIITFIEDNYEKMLIVCVDGCIREYLEYCDIALYYNTFASGYNDMDIINYSDIITCAMHDDFKEIEERNEADADINLISTNKENSYDGMQLQQFWNMKMFDMDPAPKRLDASTSNEDMQVYMQSQVNQPCRQILWMQTSLNGDILINLALRISYLTKVNRIRFYLNGVFTSKDI